MDPNGWLLLGVYVAVLAVLTPVLGNYMYRVFEGKERPLAAVFGPLERLHHRLCGVDPEREQDWKEYAGAVLSFSLVSLLITYAIQRLQHLLPWNPQGFAAVAPDLAFNTAASFTTNTNWQSYAGESTMSYFTQMAGLAWHNFTSAAAGMGVALALARGLTRRAGPDGPRGLGNFWVDLTRTILYVLLPISVVVAVCFVSQGVLQNLSPYREIVTLEGAKQTLALGPVASQEVIKMLGINGGGFFNANSAHPFENPTAVTNFIQMLLMFVIPAALTFTYGRMAGDTRQGWALWACMAALFICGYATCFWAESAAANLEGKEVRFGIASSALFATVTTDASCGAVNAMHDSLTPLGGMVTMLNIQLGEVVFGGVGSGLYGVLLYALLSVFIAGLMVGRTPEYLGKKVEAGEMKAAVLYVLIFPLVILGFTAWAVVVPYGVSSLNNAGPHGLSEILYAYTSAAGNNGSAFAGLNANTPFYNVTLGLAMLAGRFWMIVPILAIAGSMVGKKTVAPSLGTFPTNGPLFSVLLFAVIVIVGALTFFPALCLGPVIEHFSALSGKVY